MHQLIMEHNKLTVKFGYLLFCGVTDNMHTHVIVYDYTLHCNCNTYIFVCMRGGYCGILMYIRSNVCMYVATF